MSDTGRYSSSIHVTPHEKQTKTKKKKKNKRKTMHVVVFKYSDCCHKERVVF